MADTTNLNTFPAPKGDAGGAVQQAAHDSMPPEGWCSLERNECGQIVWEAANREWGQMFNAAGDYTDHYKGNERRCDSQKGYVSGMRRAHQLIMDMGRKYSCYGEGYAYKTLATQVKETPAVSQQEPSDALAEAILCAYEWGGDRDLMVGHAAIFTEQKKRMLAALRATQPRPAAVEAAPTVPEWKTPDMQRVLPGVLAFINKTPLVTSLLYDINLLPEQITDPRRFDYMLAVVNHMQVALQPADAAPTASPVSREVLVKVLDALELALPRMAHKFPCLAVRPTTEWREHGSVSFDGCKCEIKTARAAIAAGREALEQGE